jgi:hypothetical protein
MISKKIIRCKKCDHIINFTKKTEDTLTKEQLCMDCYKYLCWTGEIGPGKELKDIIASMNKN